MSAGGAWPDGSLADRSARRGGFRDLGERASSREPGALRGRERGAAIRLAALQALSADPAPRPPSAQRCPEELATRFSHRVDFYARKVARQWMLGQRWADELISAGYWGLALALANRREDADPRELSAYVSQRIEGAVLDEARRCLRRVRWMDVEASSPAGSSDPEEPACFTDRVPHPGASPEDDATRRRLLGEIDHALDELPEEERRVLEGYMDGHSLAEISRRDRVPIGTLRVRFKRATRRLRGRASGVRRSRSELLDAL